MKMDLFIILPSINNPRAIRAYEKAGFIRVSWERKPEVMKECLKEDFLSETHDYDYIYSNRENLLLVKR